MLTVENILEQIANGKLVCREEIGQVIRLNGKQTEDNWLAGEDCWGLK